MTAIVERLEFPPLRDRVGAQEWETRVDLAAAYRLVAHYGWTHLIGNHISARVPGTDDEFLINPYGLMYEEITASSLVKVGLDGTILSDTEYDINQAGYVIHSAVHGARHDVVCVLHTHTEAGMGVSALASGLVAHLHERGCVFIIASAITIIRASPWTSRNATASSPTWVRTWP